MRKTIKFITILSIFMILFLPIDAAKIRPFSERKLNAYSECKEELNADNDVAMILYQKKSSHTLNIHCFLECAYTKIGWIDENKKIIYGNAQADIDDIAKMVKFQITPNMRENTMKCINSMNKETISQTCNAGSILRICVHENLFIPEKWWSLQILMELTNLWQLPNADKIL